MIGRRSGKVFEEIALTSSFCPFFDGGGSSKVERKRVSSLRRRIGLRPSSATGLKVSASPICFSVESFSASSSSLTPFSSVGAWRR